MQKLELILCSFTFTIVASSAFGQFPGAGYYGSALSNRQNYAIPCENAHLSIDVRIKHCEQGLDMRGVQDDSEEPTLLELYLARGDYEDALAIANKAIERTDESRYQEKSSLSEPRVHALEERSVVFAEMGKLSDALADGDEILRISVDDARAYNDLCWIRAVAGQELDRALADCNRALSLKTHLSSALNSRALVNFKASHLQDALADYEASLNENPKDVGSLYGRGVTKKRLGDATGDADLEAATNKDASVAARMKGFGVAL